jgi:hypothetical protein
MDDRRIEAALRAGRPDEPQYRGDISELLRSRATSPGQPDQIGDGVDVVTRQPHRPQRWAAFVGAAAAAVLLLVGLATIARRDTPPSASIPTTTSDAPTSTTSSTAPSTPGALPRELIDRWVGATPAAVSTPNPSAPAFLVFTLDQVTLEHLSGGIVNDFISDVEVAGPGELVLTLTGQIGRCVAGATGDYRWTVSAQTTTLTLEAIDDECPERAAALAGTWTHTACPTRGNDCLGLLEAGTYRSVNFDPFDTDSYGQVTYTVPDGWTSTFDDKGRLELLPPDANEQGTHGVFLFSDVAPTTADCLATPLATVGKPAIADAITTTPGLVTSTAVTAVGGYEAQAIDITATDLDCDGEQPLLASRPGAETSWTLTIGEGQQMRIVLVDVADDRTLALVISSDHSTSEYAALLDASTAVIDSMVFSDTP